MFPPATVEQHTIDGWPLDHSGLPTRVVAALHRAGLTCVGQLRELSAQRLDELKGVGARSRQAITDFLSRCEWLASPSSSPHTAIEMIQQLLSPRDFTILKLRYGLTHPARGAHRTAHSLQAVGSHFGVTRERARQLVAQCCKQLSTSYAQAVLSPLIDFLVDTVRDHRGAMRLRDLAHTAGRAIDAPADPVAVARLMAECTANLNLWRDVISTTASADMEELARQALKETRGRDRGIDLKALAQSLSARLPLALGETERLLELIVDQLEGISATADGRCFAEESAAGEFLVDAMRSIPLPASHHDILEQYNQGMRPGSRRGKRFVLNLLKDDRRFVRKAPGSYGLCESRSVRQGGSR